MLPSPWKCRGTVGTSPAGPARDAFARRLAAVLLAAAIALPPVASTAAAESGRGVREKQRIRTERLGIVRPAGIAYDGGSDQFMVLPDGATTGVERMDRFHHSTGSDALPMSVPDARTVGYDRLGGRLLVLDVAGRALHAVPAAEGGALDAPRAVRLAAPRLGPVAVAGMTVDPASGEVFVLDRLMRRIVRFTPAAEASPPPAHGRIDLGALATADLSGLAFDPASGHLFTLETARGLLHELALDGARVASYDVSGIRLADPRAIVFAPSGDQTDDPATLSLFVADPGSPTSRRGHVVELAWTTPLPASAGDPAIESATAVAAATLVRVTQTSNYSPPSPDPSGVCYDSVRGRLVISDAEVEEMTIYAGKNVFESALTGGLLRSWTTLPWDIEPTGTAFNPNTRQYYITNDDADRLWVVNPGQDNLIGTSDDTRTSFKTNNFGSGDPEGVAYDPVGNRLFIADGVNEEIYVVNAGPNGVFDGVPSGGDDIVTHFDTRSLGAVDPETVEWKSDSGTLLILGSTGSKIVYETTTTGTKLAQTDISFAPLSKPAGLAYAPSSGGGGWSYYIVTRGVDNDSNPNENDGTLVEISVGGAPPANAAPVVNAGPDQTIALPAPASLDGTVTDDGLPSPPNLTATWSKVSGPGTVTFGNANAVDTQASFSLSGTYVLRLLASDGALSASDQVQVTVLPVGSTVTFEARIAAGADDVEESSNGSVSTNSTDLELVFDRSGNQTAGFRFTNVNIPQGATVATAWIQFQADEAQSEVTNLVLQGVATDNAGPLPTGSGSVSALARTGAAAAWAPAPWNTVGQAGPDQRTSELRTVIQELVSRGGWASGNALAIVVTGTGHRTAEAFEGLAAAAPLLHVEYSTGGPPPANTAPVVNAGPDQTITLPAQAVLDGTVTDDGLPSPSNLTTTWSQVSGPGTVTFTNANAVDTQASFSAAGTYVLQLLASDGALSASDQVQVTVQPPAANTAPVASAGPDLTVTLPAPAALDGTVTDDGLPSPPNLTTTWSKVSGPGTVTFGNANAVDTQVSFSAAGTYVLQLLASDGALSASDQAQVTVLPAGSTVALDVRIASGADDVEESATGSVYTNSSDIELVFDGSNQTVGLRFTNVAIPQGAAIATAWIQFQADEAQSEVTTLLLQGHAADNAPAFTAASGGVSSLQRTIASAGWSPAAWNVVGQAGPDQRTTELKDVIQEIVSRGGWASGNALTILVTGSGRRTAEAYEGVPAVAPLLHVEYTTAGPALAPPAQPARVGLN